MTEERTVRLVRSLDRVLRDDTRTGGSSASTHVDALAKMVVVTILAANKDRQADLKRFFRVAVERAFRKLKHVE
jgi:hypothetical protein